MSMKLNVGIIGCGNISPAYFKGCKQHANIEIIACADIDETVAAARAQEFEVPQALSVEALLGSDEIDIVINLTTPQFHAPLNKRILEAGKHAYCEKPFAANREEGLEVLELAKEKGLYVGCAPDTFLGGCFQTTRQLIDEGIIGRPFAAVAVCAGRGHEHWHPNPEFYYKVGGGPLLDMGPYYLTVLANVLGPIASVSASAKTTYPQRTITSEPLNGTVIDVETPTHYTGILEFKNGVTAMTNFSFDARGKTDLPRLMIYGSEGSLALPDPNRFEGPVLRSKSLSDDWQEVPLRHSYKGARGIGVADMAHAIAAGGLHRTNGRLAYHVFDVMTSYEQSQAEGRRIDISSSFEPSAVMPETDQEAAAF